VAADAGCRRGEDVSPPVLPVTVAIPTYQREQVLLDTLAALLALQPGPAEILVLDQTKEHLAGTEQRLSQLHRDGAIRWSKLEKPSITGAMNQAICLASQDFVLFVDDDIVPEPRLLHAHLAAHDRHAGGLVAGRVIQPWQEDGSWRRLQGFHFAAEASGVAGEFIGCNFSVRRQRALELGGFDENFVRVGYRYEAEFAHRLLAAGGSIWYEAGACLHHLKAPSGGTRTFGEHLTTWRPDHAVGAYYCGLRTRSLREFATRPLRAVATRAHLRHPWRVPATLVAEITGMAWALALFARGPKLMRPSR
jgi:GT2 family glycosyltransferase